MLFNEPKLLKFLVALAEACDDLRFSALQRAEIAEIGLNETVYVVRSRFSALQRAEIAEMF